MHVYVYMRFKLAAWSYTCVHVLIPCNILHYGLAIHRLSLTICMEKDGVQHVETCR